MATGSRPPWLTAEVRRRHLYDDLLPGVVIPQMGIADRQNTPSGVQRTSGQPAAEANTSAGQRPKSSYL
jgi:hypothetical protein